MSLKFTLFIISIVVIMMIVFYPIVETPDENDIINTSITIIEKNYEHSSVFEDDYNVIYKTENNEIHKIDNFEFYYLVEVNKTYNVTIEKLSISDVIIFNNQRFYDNDVRTF